MEFLYQGRKYTIKELDIDQKDFERCLILPNFLQECSGIETFCTDPTYKIAFSFFSELYNQVASARFALIMGHRKLHDSNYISWSSGKEGQYWLRFQYLKNATNWYNSSFDILLQAIWFGFSLYKNIEFGKDKKKVFVVDSAENFKFLQENCKWYLLKRSLEKVNSIHSKDLLENIDKLRTSQAYKNTKEWANNLKHHGTLKIKESYYPGSALVDGLFDSRYTRPIVLEIDAICENLKVFHVEFFELAKYVFDFFDFESMPLPEIDGIAEFGHRNESEYKKIIIK